jgi:RNA polymerase sigma factor (sigma-70 family)
MNININNYIKLVHHIAHKYRWAGATHEELVSAGIEGLVEAKERFDPEAGTKYITYAHWWVRAYIQKAVNSHIKNNHKSLNQEDSLGRQGIDKVETYEMADTASDMTPVIHRLLAAFPVGEQLIISKRFDVSHPVSGNREDILKESRAELSALKVK